ncbi:MAG: hypothetical protein EOP09_07810 [Proteobacteria bacterium]|nr:MAG: hypothetical protein EOP09_07810 [Pseudomonadota bacterium]
MRQIKFDFMNDFKNYFGGSLLTGVRKGSRVLSTKKPIHAILKSSGSRFFSPGNISLEKLIHSHASKYKIKIHRISLNWSHIHMIFMIPSREAYKAFIRTLTAAMVRAISKFTGKSLKGIFDLRPYTRILEWGRDYMNVMNYHDLNDLEASGYIKRTKKKRAALKTKKSNIKNPDSRI